MNFSKLTVSARLAIGFGSILVMLLMMIGVVYYEFSGISKISERIVQKDFAKVIAASKINELSRSNARYTLELFVVQDKAENKKIFDAIDNNVKVLDEQFAILDKLVYTDKGKADLVEMKDKRAKYSKSYHEAIDLLFQDKRDEATKLLQSDSLPKLNELLAINDDFLNSQKDIFKVSGEEIAKDISSGTMIMMVLGFVALLCGIVGATIITRSLLKQLGGEPNYAAEVAGRIATGDLTVTIHTHEHDQTSMLVAMKVMRDSIPDIVRQVRVATDTISTSSAEIASGNLELSSRTEEQASSLEETAASMEQLTSTVKQNAENSRQANQLSQKASEVAVKGGAVVAQVVDTMGSINESSRKIVDIISVIDGIAFQTNILALNAAVEAARAGEQGRGFAVVASEVRNLAQRSASAAKEIKDLISKSVENVEIGTKLVDGAGVTMKEVVDSISRVTDIVAEITHASQEQSQGISQVNEAVIQMDNVTQQNAALVEEASAAASSMESQAFNLTKLVSIFKLDDGLYRTGSEASVRPSVNAKPLPVSTTKAVKASTTPKISAKPGPEASAAPAPSAHQHDGWEEF